MKTWLEDPRTINRFWHHVKIGRPDECWIYGNGTHRGSFGVGPKKDRKILPAPKAAYLLTKGRIPKGLWVCHECDVDPCCNPNHLFLGTAQDNSDDMMSKGRHRAQKGEEHHGAKQTVRSVLRIRQMFAAGYSATFLSIKFNTCKANIQKIVERRAWRHI